LVGMKAPMSPPAEDGKTQQQGPKKQGENRDRTWHADNDAILVGRPQLRRLRSFA
jgi:hypothetical protein